MTKGYLVLAKGKNIIKAVYSYGDSYPSSLGLKVLKLFKEGKIIKNFNFIKERVEGVENSDYTGNALDSVLNGNENTYYNSEDVSYYDLIPSKDDKSYVEYVYLYDVSKNELKLYYYGKLLYKITKENIDIHEYIFANEEYLYYALSYDENKCTLSKDHVKEFRRCVKDNKLTIDNLKELVNVGEINSGIYIDDTKCNDLWEGSYKRIVEGKSLSCRLEFIISDGKPHKGLYIQLPYVRKNIFKCGSKKKCEEYLIDLVKNKKEYLINISRYYVLCEKYLNHISETTKVVKNTDEFISNISDVLNIAQEEFNNFFTGSCEETSIMYKDDIMKELRWSFQRQLNWLEKIRYNHKVV